MHSQLTQNRDICFSTIANVGNVLLGDKF